MAVLSSQGAGPLKPMPWAPVGGEVWGAGRIGYSGFLSGWIGDKKIYVNAGLVNRTSKISINIVFFFLCHLLTESATIMATIQILNWRILVHINSRNYNRKYWCWKDLYWGLNIGSSSNCQVVVLSQWKQEKLADMIIRYCCSKNRCITYLRLPTLENLQKYIKQNNFYTRFMYFGFWFHLITCWTISCATTIYLSLFFPTQQVELY